MNGRLARQSMASLRRMLDSVFKMLPNGEIVNRDFQTTGFGGALEPNMASAVTYVNASDRPQVIVQNNAILPAFSAHDQHSKVITQVHRHNLQVANP